MQTYKNTGNASCVWDAFNLAGLPITNDMRHGIRADDVIRLLESHGYTIYYKGYTPHLCPYPIGGYFVIRDWKKNYYHIEYHNSVYSFLDYDPSSVGAIACK